MNIPSILTLKIRTLPQVVRRHPAKVVGVALAALALVAIAVKVITSITKSPVKRNVFKAWKASQNSIDLRLLQWRSPESSLWNYGTIYLVNFGHSKPEFISISKENPSRELMHLKSNNPHVAYCLIGENRVEIAAEIGFAFRMHTYTYEEFFNTLKRNTPIGYQPDKSAHNLVCKRGNSTHYPLCEIINALF